MNKWILVLLLISAGCGKHKTKPVTAISQVLYKEVESKTVPFVISSIGHFKASDEAQIKAQVEGYLQSYGAAEGNLVKKNDLLFTIDPRPYQAKLEEAQAQLEVNKANLLYAIQQLERYTKLEKDEFVSKLNIESYEADVKKYEGLVAQSNAQIKSAEINLKFCYLRAPFNGRLGIRKKDIGSLISNNGESIITLTNISPIYLDFTIPEKELSAIYQYQKKSPLEVSATISGSEEIFKGELIVIDNQVSSGSGMIPLRAAFTNADGALWPGLFAKVQTKVYDFEDAIVIPKAAVNIGVDGTYSYVINSASEAVIAPIEIAYESGDTVVVKKGLKKGEKVVVEGQLKVNPNHKVRAKEQGS